MGSGGSIPSSPELIGEHQPSSDTHDQKSSRIVNDLPLCLIHSRVIEFYCSQCDQDLCSKCIVTIHKGHDFILFEEKNSNQKTVDDKNKKEMESKDELNEKQRKKSFPNQSGNFASHSHPHLSSYNFQQSLNDPKAIVTSREMGAGVTCTAAGNGTSKQVSRQGSNVNMNLITFPPPPSSENQKSSSPTSSSSSKTIPFPFYGMSMRLLKALYQYVKSIDPNDQMTTLDVSEQIIKPWTEKSHCSLAELFLSDYMFQSHEILKLNASQSVSTHPTIFVSHAWRYKFSELISAISSFDRSQKEKMKTAAAAATVSSADQEEEDFQVITYDLQSSSLDLTKSLSHTTNTFGITENSYWIDVCVNNQWEAPKLPYEWWSSTFLSAIGKIGHTCLVLSPWDDPIPLKRAWCLWEIVCTKTTHSQFTIQFSPSERIKFQQVLRVNFQYIMKAISSIDLESSEAWNPIDREMIFDVVRRLDGGFQAVNMIIFDVLREWLSESGKDAIDFTDQIYYFDNYENMKKNLYLMNNVGQLMKEQGKYEEAEHLYRLALSGYNRIDWKRYEKDKKEKLQKEKKRKEEEGEGEQGEGEGEEEEEEEQDHHLSTTNNLAILLNITGRRSEAEMLFKEILQAYIRRYGDEDKDTLAIKNNLANIYNDKGERNLASAMYQEVLAGYLKILGKSNPETLSCMHNLATVWNDQGKTTEAEELMREVGIQERSSGEDSFLLSLSHDSFCLFLSPPSHVPVL
jgi:tetratricopeptide (TPR) repeat protein